MNPEPVAHSLVSIILWLFAILVAVDVILKLWLMWLKHRASELDSEIRELTKELLRAKNAASDDSYWFDPEGHSHFCNPPSTNHQDD